jgi:type II secretory pathway component PulJ
MYHLAFASGGNQRVDVEDFRQIDPTTSDGFAAAVELVLQADVIAVATGNSCKDWWPVFAEADNQSSGPTALLAFENAERASTRLLESAKAELDHTFTSFHPCDVVCDRICSRLLFEGETKAVHPGVCVLTESYGAVQIQTHPEVDSLLRDMLETSPDVELVANESLFDAYEKRKAWLVNASHYAYGATALKRLDPDGNPTILGTDEAAADEEIDAIVADMQREFVWALMIYASQNGVSDHEEFQEEELVAYCEQVRTRVRTGPDDPIDRLFTPLLNYSPAGKMWADLATEIAHDVDGVLRGHLEAIVDRHPETRVKTLLGRWSSHGTLQFSRQKSAERVKVHLVSLIRRIGLQSFFEKARGRIHEPLGLILDVISRHPNAQVGHPLAATRVLLDVEAAVLYHIRRAEEAV